MRKEVYKLENMQCWEVVTKPKKKRVLQTKLVLKRRRVEIGMKKKYKVSVVVYWNEKNECEDDDISPVSDFTVIKILLCQSIQRK